MFGLNRYALFTVHQTMALELYSQHEAIFVEIMDVF